MRAANQSDEANVSAEWQLAEAKNKFSEVYRRAVAEGRQRITKRGDEPVYVISESDLLALEGEKPDFIQFLLNGPDFSELDLERDQSLPRDVDL